MRIVLKAFIYTISVLIFFSYAYCETYTNDSIKDLFFNHFKDSIEASKNNKEIYINELHESKKTLEELKTTKNEYFEKINLYKNILIIPDAKLSILEKSADESELITASISARLAKINEKIKKTEIKIISLKEKQNFASNIVNQFKSLKDMDEDSKKYLKDIIEYSQLINEQQDLLEQLKKIEDKKIDIYNSIISPLLDLQSIFQKNIKDKKGQILFDKEQNPLLILSYKSIKKGLISTSKAIDSYFSKENILKKRVLLKEHVNTGHLVIILSFISIYIFLKSASKYFKKNEKYNIFKDVKTGYLLGITGKASTLIFFILVFKILLRTKLYIVFPDLFKFLSDFFILTLLTQVTLDSIGILLNEKIMDYRKKLLIWRNIFVWEIRCFGVIYLFLFNFGYIENSLFVLLRLIFELFLIISVFLFWKNISKINKSSYPLIIKLGEWSSKIITITALFAEIAGYRYFPIWWFVSWSITIVVVCIAAIIFLSVKAFDNDIKNKINIDDKENKVKNSYPFYWLFSRGAYALILVLILIGIAFAWDKGEEFLNWSVSLFIKKIKIGKIELSLSGFLYSIIVFIITYLFTHFWQRLLKDRFLKESGLSEGVKSSIVKISVYLVWTAGILISFSVLGLNSASMAFGFGALGIGLGFGLQNIFNNFISGLILLFERPIQVGDVIEIGGIWGEVEKINVRSTIVQTYTNSSLIIPNSEFISSQVTNWSHKDPYIRRDLNIGVAYGSDTSLVEKILLEVAAQIPEVKNFPKMPKVQFINFGESSLDFRLRFWTTIDNFVSVESKMRYLINENFNKNNIEIPFPKRDIYIKPKPAKKKDLD